MQVFYFGLQLPDLRKITLRVGIPRGFSVESNSVHLVVVIEMLADAPVRKPDFPRLLQHGKHVLFPVRGKTRMRMYIGQNLTHAASILLLKAKVNAIRGC